MTLPEPASPIDHVQPCSDLPAALETELAIAGTRLLSIFPADGPRVAVIERDGKRLRLDATPGATEGKCPGLQDDAPPVIPPLASELVHTPLAGPESWSPGRAGMQYRDLIPGRLGGHAIASHIRIETGGLVPDYVHHHAVQYQLIACVKGWVRVVYEDQGPSFVMHAGDAVLQPPGIRHRVLKSSDGLEVVEIACPAEHATRVDHELELPRSALDLEREYGGQAFVRHVAEDATWAPWTRAGYVQRDLGIGAGTRGLAGARVVRMEGQPGDEPVAHTGDLCFVFVQAGAITFHGQAPLRLNAGDALTIPRGLRHHWADATEDVTFLEVTAPAQLTFER